MVSDNAGWAACMWSRIAADAAASTVIRVASSRIMRRDQRVINLATLKPWRRRLRFNVAELFPRNLALVSVLYLGERPEITPHDEESEKAQNKSKKNQTKEQKMKLKTQILAIALGVAASTSLVWSAG